MKKLLILIFVAGLVFLGITLISKPESDEVLYGEPAPIYAWEQYLGQEDPATRTHITKHYPDDKVVIQSSGLLHYSENGEFKDLLPLPFPEGKEITSEKDKHFMMNLPEWGTIATASKQVKVHDETGQPIYVFKNPLVVEKGKNPYKIIDKDGKKVKETKDPKEKLEITEKIVQSDDAIEVEFYTEDNKLYFTKVTETGLNYPLEAYDDTDTDSTNNKDVNLWEWIKDTNYGGVVYLEMENRTAEGKAYNTIMHWSLSAGIEEISVVKVFIYNYNVQFGPKTVEVHLLTRTDWVEDEATWNIYKTGSNWTTPGGDFNATVIDSIVLDVAREESYRNWVLMGTGGSGTPLTLDWEDEVHLWFHDNTDTGDEALAFNSKEAAANKPYLEITYEAVAVDTGSMFNVF